MDTEYLDILNFECDKETGEIEAFFLDFFDLLDKIAEANN